MFSGNSGIGYPRSPGKNEPLLHRQLQGHLLQNKYHQIANNAAG
jgi:hypothetical protein